MPDLYELVELPRDTGPARLRQVYEQQVNLAAKRMDQNRLLALSRAYDLLPQATQDAMYPKLSTRTSTLSAMPSAGSRPGKRGRGGRKSNTGSSTRTASSGSYSGGSPAHGPRRGSRFSRRSGPRRMSERRRTFMIAIAVIVLVALATQWSRINSAFDSAGPDNLVNSSTGYQPPAPPTYQPPPSPAADQSQVTSHTTTSAPAVVESAAEREVTRMEGLVELCRRVNHGRLPANAVDEAGLVRLDCGSRSMSSALQTGEQLVYRQVTASTYMIALTERDGTTVTYNSATHAVTG